MRIAVAGGTGTVGTHAVDALRRQGHTPVVLSRENGVDLIYIQSAGAFATLSRCPSSE